MANLQVISHSPWPPSLPSPTLPRLANLLDMPSQTPSQASTSNAQSWLPCIKLSPRAPFLGQLTSNGQPSSRATFLPRLAPFLVT